ncbi:MAG: peptidoglycan DD-metalloendopeptidase family protein [Nitrospinaceae bacterium]|nr:M23 family metallopeptidase [Nitrospinaceae bacterium]NIR53646.1 M23 family metallopeptidase [Nitrospinaceae bacterium]NIS84052.1 M23 family metallopeptidase [Nitrospinaceae bacterium]NIT80853.1 M23 family metallopeptidase [Nitrospinaceae bacterium]NIU43162.1 M23 family metallopeptidase [Nitrospinaceae bacterium]
MSFRHSLFRLLLCLPVMVLLANCGGVSLYDFSDREGVYHPVKRGQTLYSIAKAYGVSVREIQEANGIWSPESLEEGQHLWIPYATHVVAVAPTVPGYAEVPAPAVKKKKPRAVKPRLRKARIPPRRPRPAVKHLRWPVKNGILTSRFGTRNGKNHHGIDIAARRGTPIYAAGGGKVKFSGWGPTGYGLMIIVKHPGHLTTVYAHNSRNLVKEGAKVKKGQMIGRIGKTGRATGPHLHFEVRNDTHPKNPLLYLKK